MAGHWYSAKDGSAVYEVKRAKGDGMRSTTLADARKLNLVPSVTTILGTISKPLLERWKQEQILNAVLSYPFDLSKHSIDEWKRKIIHLSQKEGNEAAERGNIIHNAMEEFYILGKIADSSLHPFCLPAIEVIKDTFGHMANFLPEKSFGHSLGYGGKCDLYMQPCGDFPQGVVLDYKTKSSEDLSKLKPYIEYCMQLSAYREGFDIPNAECYNLFISTKKPGELKLYKWSEKELKKGWQMFKSLLNYWKLDNNFGENHV